MSKIYFHRNLRLTLFLFGTTLIPSLLNANLIKSGLAAKAARVFLVLAAVPILLAISNALAAFLATFFPNLTVALPTLLRKSFKPSSSIFE